LADLAGGTPFNRAAPLAGTSVRLFGGVNLAFLLELLSARGDGAPDYAEVLAFGHAGLREFVPAELKEEELL
jgi:mannose/fructose-specific phosphotransferase system component IIA